MDHSDQISLALLVAEEMLDSVAGEMNRLPEAVQVFLNVNGAQGAIDNGGFEFFFAHDWPGSPPYEDFVGAYESIGCVEQAAVLRRMVATFSFSEPHLHQARRREFMEARFDKSGFIPEWKGSLLCFNDQVWRKLANYYETHEDHFA